MGKLEKAKESLRSIPKDYTYSEARVLLIALGFQEFKKGKTSGSRMMFYRETDNAKILLHKPHPGDQMVIGAIRDLKDKLERFGDLS